MFHMEHALALAWSTVTNMIDGFFTALPNLIIAVFIVMAFFSLGNVSRELSTKFGMRTHLDRTLAHALGTLCNVVVSLVGLLAAAVVVIPHFSMASVIGGLGISSVAIGFAFKDILQNFLAGMLLLWQKPFSIGDQIKTQNFEGTVEDIRIRSTLLRTFTGELALIPNGDIYTNPVIVNAASSKRKVHLTVNARDSQDLEGARQQIVKTLETSQGVEKEPTPQVYVSDPSSDQLTFDVYFWTAAQQADLLAVTDRVATQLRQMFRVKPVTAVPEIDQAEDQGEKLGTELKGVKDPAPAAGPPQQLAKAS
jgi:small conductance mechanosensitive channel